MSESAEQNHDLKRSISLPLLIFYGLGTMVGGGIYALTGKVVGMAGMYAPIAFALSAVLALITAFSYAELASRFPFSAGEVRYISAAFARKSFASLSGWLIIFTGIVSSAALANATTGFIQDFIDLPELWLTAAIVLTLGGVAAWGITQSVALVTLITLIEIGGLLLIVFVGLDDLATLGARWPELVPPIEMSELALWSGIFSGAFLAFYAFIGFEDMVNIAEEVKDVRRTMPVAIIICIILTLVFYVLVALVAVLAVEPNTLAASNTPLATIMESTGPGVPPALMGVISILATVNGVLVQIIMGSRVLYGMANGGHAPAFFSYISQRTRTPIWATGSVVIATLVCAMLFDLTTLAKVTSAIILFIFVSVNAALLKLKLSGTIKEDNGFFLVPWWLPLLGLVVCSAMLIFEIGKTLAF